MSNVKAQSRQGGIKSNPKFKYQKILISEFDIHLAFEL